MAVINDGSNAGSGVYIDPLTGMPGKKPKATKAPVGFGYLTDPGTGGVYGSHILVNGVPVTGDAPAAASAPMDIAQILAGDPSYQQFLADLKAASIADRENLKAARQRAIIMFGGNPNLTSAGALVGGDFSGDITPETLAAAAAADKSGVSTTARLKAAHDEALRQIRNSLIQRGAYNSGETGWNYGREGQQYNIQQYDAMQKLVDYLAGINSSYAQSERERQLQQAQQQQNALYEWLQTHPNATGAGGASGGAPTPTPAPVGGSPADWWNAWQQYGGGTGGL